MSFGKPSAAEAAWTSQKAGALTQQIGKDERMARRALDAKLAKLEAEEGEVKPVVVEAVQPVAPSTSRALHGRTMGGYLPRPMMSTSQEEFAAPPPAEEEQDRSHFHKLDAIGRHAEAQVRFAALMKDGAVKPPK